ncbi:hypothetical protein MHY1_02025 [Methylovirgula sp. HY1]|nr:hypothetical protein MHY1_02025 [Methylovirgula sp. HY1]
MSAHSSLKYGHKTRRNLANGAAFSIKAGGITVYNEMFLNLIRTCPDPFTIMLFLAPPISFDSIWNGRILPGD